MCTISKLINKMRVKLYSKLLLKEIAVNKKRLINILFTSGLGVMNFTSEPGVTVIHIHIHITFWAKLLTNGLLSFSGHVH